MEEFIISTGNLKSLADALIKEGKRVYSPSKEGSRFVTIKSGEDLRLVPEDRPTDISPKGVIFPKTDVILFYKKEKSSVDLIDPEIKWDQVAFGLKPCDTAGLSIMSKVFNWDYRDEFFNKRREKTVLIGLACKYRDNACFCTSVNLSPVSNVGSDLFMVKISDDSFSTIVVTDKGRQFIESYKNYFVKGDGSKAQKELESINSLPKSFEYKRVKEWLDKNFETEIFNPIGDICLGCGQCAFVCPTCHCFDIVDEDYSYNEGRRMKNWDSCQFSLFTLHASGHNPRENQAKRYRQRINHKFKYYQDRFNEILCTGCGRCSRGCPVSIDIKEVVSRIGNIS